MGAKLKAAWNNLKTKVKEQKEGGTMLGNALRATAKGASYGILGNGVMMKKEGETSEDVWERTKESLATAVEGAGFGALATQNKEQAKGLLLQKFPWIKYLIIFGGFAIGLPLIIWVIRKLNKSNNSKK